MNKPSFGPVPERAPIVEPAPAMIEAIVQTATSETVYRRAGTGAQVLLLTVGDGSDPLAAALLPALAEHFRVIAPRLAAGCEGGMSGGAVKRRVAVSAWLRDVIDGLGLARPSIVADEALGIAALDFALSDPERVDRLVVVRREPADLALHHDALDDTLARFGHPLLLLGFAAAPGQELLSTGARDALRRFLAGDGGAAEVPPCT